MMNKKTGMYIGLGLLLGVVLKKLGIGLILGVILAVIANSKKEDKV